MEQKNNLKIMRKSIKSTLEAFKNLLNRIWIIRASINLIDYVYYRIYLVCAKYIKQDVKEAWAVLLMLSILVTPLLISKTVFFPTLNLKDYVQDSLYLLLALPLLIRYCFVVNKNNYETFQDRWRHETDKQKQIRGRIILIALLLSNIIYPIFIIILLLLDYNK